MCSSQQLLMRNSDSNLLSLLVFSLGVFAVSKLEIKAKIRCSQHSQNYATETMMECPNVPSLMNFGVLDMFCQRAKPKAQSPTCGSTSDRQADFCRVTPSGVWADVKAYRAQKAPLQHNMSR